jgi:hypothetical protein
MFLISMSVVGCATTAPNTAPDLGARRAQMLGWLHEYIQRAEYPTDAAGLPVSEFLDERGARCPMAELMHRDGHDDLVAWGVRANNKLRLVTVEEGPLADWMASTGLSRAEIDLVQGALDVDVLRRLPTIGEPPQVTIRASRAEVHGRLAASERALRTAAAPQTTVASPQKTETKR